MSVVDREQVEQIVSTLWTTMFHSEPEFIAKPGKYKKPLNYGSYVTISGTFTGGVIVQTSADHAVLLTATLLEKNIEEVEQEEIKDVMREIANIVGGQVKAILEGECYLSLPSVRDNVEEELTILDAEVSQSVYVRSSDEITHVQVVHHI